MTIDENIDPAASDVKFNDFVRRWERTVIAAQKMIDPLLKEAEEAGYVTLNGAEWRRGLGPEKLVK